MPEDPHTPNNPPTMSLTSDAVIDASGFQVTLLNAKFVVPADVAKAVVSMEPDIENSSPEQLAHKPSWNPRTQSYEENAATSGRKRLLARIAGNVASGYAELRLGMDPYHKPTLMDPETHRQIAVSAVAIAEQILKEVGL